MFAVGILPEQSKDPLLYRRTSPSPTGDQLGYRHPKVATKKYVIQYEDNAITRAAYHSLIESLNHLAPRVRANS